MSYVTLNGTVAATGIGSVAAQEEDKAKKKAAELIEQAKRDAILRQDREIDQQDQDVSDAFRNSRIAEEANAAQIQADEASAQVGAQTELKELFETNAKLNEVETPFMNQLANLTPSSANTPKREVPTVEEYKIQEDILNAMFAHHLADTKIKDDQLAVLREQIEQHLATARQVAQQIIPTTQTSQVVQEEAQRTEQDQRVHTRDALELRAALQKEVVRNATAQGIKPGISNALAAEVAALSLSQNAGIDRLFLDMKKEQARQQEEQSKALQKQLSKSAASIQAQEQRQGADPALDRTRTNVDAATAATIEAKRLNKGLNPDGSVGPPKYGEPGYNMDQNRKDPTAKEKEFDPKTVATTDFTIKKFNADGTPDITGDHTDIRVGGDAMAATGKNLGSKGQVGDTNLSAQETRENITTRGAVGARPIAPHSAPFEREAPYRLGPGDPNYKANSNL